MMFEPSDGGFFVPMMRRGFGKALMNFGWLESEIGICSICFHGIFSVRRGN